MGASVENLEKNICVQKLGLFLGTGNFWLFWTRNKQEKD